MVLDYIKEKYPFWQRKEGLDHFVFVNSDWGACEVGGMWLYSYGELHPIMDEVSAFTLFGCSKNMNLNDERPCFRKGRDMVLPPFQDPTVFK